MYRNRDWGRLLEDGSLLFKSPISADTEIKLREMRVDLTKVERAILSATGGTLPKSLCRRTMVWPGGVGSIWLDILFSHMMRCRQVPRCI